MEKPIFSILGLLCVVTMEDAGADIFRCTNAQGKVLTSDRPIPECVTRGMKVYSNNGRFKNHILPPQSAEEKQKVAQELARKKNEELEEEERKKEERYMLAHYRNEADVEVARKRAVDVLSEKQRFAKEQLEALSQLILGLQDELKKSKKTTQEYDSIRRRADDLSANVNSTRKAIAFYEQEITRTNQEYEETLKRYRAVLSKSRRSN
jgi:hypothetical protein